MKIKNIKFKQINKEQKLAIFITILTVLVLAGITYTFFSASVSNDNNEKLQTSTATLSLKFDDNDNGVGGTLNLGESIVKKFTLENTGTVEAYAKINWYNLVNTYTSDSLTWTLEQSTSENGPYTELASGKVPTSSTETTKQLKNGILVPVNATYYYKLTITLNDLDVNQNSDINASFYSYFNLEEGSLTGADTIQNLVAGEPTNTTDVITKPAPQGATCTNSLAYDGTADNNLRYVGANPCNYVTFNGETAGWRIIGVMNNVDDGSGNLETRIKLVRNDPLDGDSWSYYAWDTSSSNINYGTGYNDWTQAVLMTELNGDYLDTTLTENTMWYHTGNHKGIEYDHTKGLSNSAQALIDNAKWYLGGISSETAMTQGEGTASDFYEHERGTEVWPQGAGYSATCNDSACPRATSWTGKVALPYPSDFGYAIGEEERSHLLTNNLMHEYYSNWLVLAARYSEGYWLLTPDSSSPDRVFTLINGGSLSFFDPECFYAVNPAVYLKSDVIISGGNGSMENPYIIE